MPGRPRQRETSQIFWPSHLLGSNLVDNCPGYLVGWNPGGLVSCVVAVVPATSATLEDLETILLGLLLDPDLRPMLEHCISASASHQKRTSVETRRRSESRGASDSAPSLLPPISPAPKSSSSPVEEDALAPVVLGEIRGASSDGPLHAGTYTKNIWLTMVCHASKSAPHSARTTSRSLSHGIKISSGMPFLTEVRCYGYRYSHTASQMVIYTPPTRNHFFCVDPLPLWLGQPIQFLLQRERRHRRNVDAPHRTADVLTDLEQTLRCLNCASILEEYVKREATGYTSRSALPARKDSNASDADENAMTDSPRGHRGSSSSSSSRGAGVRRLTSTSLLAEVRSWGRTLPGCLLPIVMVLKWAGDALLSVLDTPLRLQNVPFLHLHRVMDVSHVGTQFALRWRNISLWTSTLSELMRSNEWKNQPDIRAVSIGLRNSLGLAVLDVLLGLVFGTVLFVYAGDLAELLIAQTSNPDTPQVLVWHAPVRAMLEWFMTGNPGGFKLNEGLNDFYGRFYMSLLDHWDVITSALLPYLALFLRIISVAGLMGITMLLAWMADIISMLTMNFFFFYVCGARIYWLHLGLLDSLWRLFTGQKHNVLRKRTDSCDYNVDQLLIGTLLFTVLGFLWPTTALYYTLWVMVRAVCFLVRVSFEVILGLFNNFPLHSLVLLVFEPRSVPGGVRFRALKMKGQKWHPEQESTTFLKLESRPTALRYHFYSYSQTLRERFGNYNVMSVLSQLLTGNPLRPNTAQ